MGLTGTRWVVRGSRELLAQALYDDGRHDVATICRTLGISRATFYRYVRPPSRDQTTEEPLPSG